MNLIEMIPQHPLVVPIAVFGFLSCLWILVLTFSGQWFGDYKHYSSLKLLTSILGIPSPKDDIDGSEVASVYYKEENLERIVTYCEKDTVAVAQLLLRFNNEDLLEDFQIISA